MMTYRGHGFDPTMMGARTAYGMAWDFRFTGVCPHGVETVWVGNPMGYPICTCECS